jgi:DNA-binding LacI/PurR family transcriptional regulator
MNRAVYVLSGELKKAIRDSGIPQVELGARVGWDQARVSHLLRGTRFSEETRAAVLMLAVTLGIEPGAAVRYVRVRRESR